LRHPKRRLAQQEPGRGRAGRGAKLGVVLGLTALAATGCSWSDLPRFGWPSAITPQGSRMLHLWSASWIAAFALGALVWGLTFWTVVFHRKKNDELPKQVKYNGMVEATCIIVPFIAIAVLFYFTAITENFVNKETKHPDVTVTVVAFKWNWQFQYDQVTSPVNKQPVNTVGTSDEIPILVLPTNQTIRINEEATDVIHSFWVPALLFKRDVVPGLHNSFEVTITKKGAYVGHCAELCGTYHSMMNFELRSVSQADYHTYLQKLQTFKPGSPNYNNRQAAALAAIGQPTKAVTTHPFSTDRTLRHSS
jgi:cytochrome c oxidase subunit 2